MKIKQNYKKENSTYSLPVFHAAIQPCGVIIFSMYVPENKTLEWLPYALPRFIGPVPDTWQSLNTNPAGSSGPPRPLAVIYPGNPITSVTETIWHFCKQIWVNIRILFLLMLINKKKYEKSLRRFNLIKWLARAKDEVYGTFNRAFIKIVSASGITQCVLNAKEATLRKTLFVSIDCSCNCPSSRPPIDIRHEVNTVVCILLTQSYESCEYLRHRTNHISLNEHTLPWILYSLQWNYPRVL